MTRKEAEEIIERYLNDSSSRDERHRVESFFLEFLDKNGVAPAAEDLMRVDREMQQAIAKGTGLNQFPFYVKKTVLRPIGVSNWYYAAAALLIIGFGLFFIVRKSESPQDRKLAQTEILPGYNQATLTLPDGHTISLDSAQSGIIVQDEDIVYNDSTPLNVMLSVGTEGGKSPDQIGTTSLPNLLSLSTPRGGQYQIILSDGTKVWLNAASTLKYPSGFNGNTREVFLEGEAYFSVNNKMAETRSTSLRSASRQAGTGKGDGRAVASAGDRVSRVPFIVKSKNQQTTVLGTEFNITAYADDATVKTTLASGAVQVASYKGSSRSEAEIPTRRDGLPDLKILKPGQQSINSEAGIQLITVDTNSETAWKNGFFNFDNISMEEAMKQLARWYDLEVIYENGVPDINLGGKIERDLPLSTILRMLKKTKVNFRIEPGRKLIIKNNQ